MVIHQNVHATLLMNGMLKFQTVLSSIALLLINPQAFLSMLLAHAQKAMNGTIRT